MRRYPNLSQDTRLDAESVFEERIGMYKSLDIGRSLQKWIGEFQNAIQLAERKKQKLLLLNAQGQITDKDFLSINKQRTQEIEAAQKELPYKAALWAAEQGMIAGEFDPGARCTRSMAVTYLWKQAGSPAAAAAASFTTDVPAGAATAFEPDVSYSRGQIMTFRYRVIAG